MFVSVINERDHPFAVEIIESATYEREAAERKIVHIRREIDFAIEPGFDRVLVGRRNIDQMGGEKRADMIRNDFVNELIALRWTRHLEKDEAQNSDRECGAGRQSQP